MGLLVHARLIPMRDDDVLILTRRELYRVIYQASEVRTTAAAKRRTTRSALQIDAIATYTAEEWQRNVGVVLGLIARTVDEEVQRAERRMRPWWRNLWPKFASK